MNTKKKVVFIIYYLESIKIKTCGYYMSCSLLKIISISYKLSGINQIFSNNQN